MRVCTRATLLLLVSLFLCSPADGSEVELLAIRAARLFGGTSTELIRNGVVLIEGNRIRSAGSGTSVPEGIRVIDLGDSTLLPGFIDSHTHLTGQASENWRQGTLNSLRRSVPEKAVRSTEYARKTLMAGFTTVRDVGSEEFIDVGLRNAIDAGAVPGPRMLASGGSLGARGGHCDWTGFPYERFGQEPSIAEGIASGADQFRDAVRFRVKYGADVIKVCATGGVLSLADEVDTPQLTQEEMDALVDEAHRLRKKTAAHAHGAEGAKVAIRAGIDSIDHGSFLDREAFQMMKKHGTYLVPTLMAFEYTGGDHAPENYPPEIAEKAQAAAEAHSTAFRLALEMGVKIAFGTDSAVSPHGLNAEEFKLMVDRGMSPTQALRSATSVAADLLGLGEDLGTLEPGKKADIIAVPGNPIADIRMTEKVHFVMKDGVVFRNDVSEGP